MLRLVCFLYVVRSRGWVIVHRVEVEGKIWVVDVVCQRVNLCVLRAEGVDPFRTRGCKSQHLMLRNCRYSMRCGQRNSVIRFLDAVEGPFHQRSGWGHCVYRAIVVNVSEQTPTGHGTHSILGTLWRT